MNLMEKRSYMRTLKGAAFAALISGSLSLFGSLPAHAALLTVGLSNRPYGGLVCADVRNASSIAGTAVQAYDCLGDLNEQFAFNGLTIYAMGNTRCLDVFGTRVVSNTCSSSVSSQTWYYFSGEIVNDSSGLCLDATTLANNTQLLTNPCNGARSQNWQIK